MTTLRHQIGQMLIMGFSGTAIDEQSPIANWLSGEGLGGVLLFDYDLIKKCPGKNLVNQEQIKDLTKRINLYAQQSEGNHLPFIAIDYEGGEVDRLKQIPGCFVTKKPSELAKLSNEALPIHLKKMAQSLQSLGFNLNFAPVIDLNLNEEQGIIGRLGRCFSSETSEVARVARIFVDIFAEHGLTCSFKHFPGHGSAIGDSHQGFVDVSDSFQKKELEPYSLLLSNKKLPAMIMTAHVINRKLDASGLPSTLSKPILTDLLRHKLGFAGVLISDDLQMQAISKYFTLDEALRLTINAGADMLIFANQLDEITATEVIDRIERLVEARLISKNRIEQAYQRIINLKQAQLLPKSIK